MGVSWHSMGRSLVGSGWRFIIGLMSVQEAFFTQEILIYDNNFIYFFKKITKFHILFISK